MTDDYLPHNWTLGVRVVSRWETDILTSKATGAEQRRQILARPQRALTYGTDTILDDVVVARALGTLARLVTQATVVPLYSDVSMVSADSSGTTLSCPTSYRRFEAGKQVVIFPPDYGALAEPQVREVTVVGGSSLTLGSSLTGTVPAGSAVMPLLSVYQALDSEVSLSRFGVASLRDEVLEVAGEALAATHAASAVSGFPTYSGLPVFDLEPDWSTPVVLSLIKDGQEQALGRAIVLETSDTKPRWRLAFGLFLSRQDYWGLLQFFDSRRGRLLPFWTVAPFPAWEATDYQSGYVDVVSSFNADDLAASVLHLGILKKDGTVLIREITGVTSPGDIRLTVDSALPFVDPADVVYLGVAFRCRFDQDSLGESWASDGYCATAVSMLEVVEEDDHPIEFSVYPIGFGSGNEVTEVPCVVYDGKHYPYDPGGSPDPNPNLSIAAADGGSAYDYWDASSAIESLEGVSSANPAPSGSSFGTKAPTSFALSIANDLGTPDPTDFLLEETRPILTHLWETWLAAPTGEKPRIL